MFNKKGWLKDMMVHSTNGMLSVLTNGTVEECLMTLSDSYYIAVGGEFYSMFSHFCKHVIIDICYVCDCLLSLQTAILCLGTFPCYDHLLPDPEARIQISSLPYSFSP